MSEAKYKDLILETIDSLRKRKARPDLERICHMVERKHTISFGETEADLEKLVGSGIVIKVDYKGSTSYRNAAKWRKSHLGGSVLNGNDASRKLRSAVSALLREAAPSADGSRIAPGQPSGVSYTDIERRLIEEEDETTVLTSESIHALVNKELSHGRLKLLPSGNYVLGETKHPKTPSPSKCVASDGARHASGGSSSSPAKKGRPPGTKRKIKHCVKSPKEPKAKRPCPPIGVRSPSISLGSGDDTNHNSSAEWDAVPEATGDVFQATPDKCGDTAAATGHPEQGARRAGEKVDGSAPADRPPAKAPGDPGHGLLAAGQKAGRAAAGRGEGMAYIETQSKCDYCLLTSECNRSGQPEYLLYCKDCQAKAHPSCMDYSEDLARRARNSPWQCIDCKTCYVCEDSGDPDAMLFCDACDKGYHMNCHNPQLLDKPTGKWVCSKCVLELNSENGDHQTNERQQPSPDNNNTSSINKNTDGGGASCLPTPNDSPVYLNDAQSHDVVKEVKVTRPPAPNAEKANRPSLTLKIFNRHTMPSLPRLSDTLPAVVPDASEWTIDDVVQFFRNVGFVDQADVFKEQEIDGRSLLLMRRSDVLTGLSLKLGPALKIYTHVQRLQMRCDSGL